MVLGDAFVEEAKKNVWQIERHINLLDDRMIEYAEKIESLIFNHKLPIKRFETLRYPERQAYLVEKGYSKTMNSRHLPNAYGKSEAVDYVVNIDGKWSWGNEHLFWYEFLGELVMSNYSNHLTWGGRWKSFRDLPHYQLK